MEFLIDFDYIERKSLRKSKIQRYSQMEWKIRWNGKSDGMESGFSQGTDNVTSF
jgi:hypothetical protein